MTYFGQNIIFQAFYDYCGYCYKWIDRFNNILKERLLVALAEDSMLSKEMLAKAPNYTIENLLLDILEEQAQVKWFEPLLGYTIKDEDLKILDNYFKKGRIYGALQDLTFKDYRWVHTFVEHNWYDEVHKIKLMQSIFIDDISYFIKKYGISQTHFKALLTGNNANLAPKAKLYLIKEKDSAFEDGI